MSIKEKSLQELQSLPNVGPKLAQQLYDAGYRSVSDFYCIDPNILFDRLDVKAQFTLPENIRYILQSIVYWVSTPPQERIEEKKFWWAWKKEADKKIEQEKDQYKDYASVKKAYKQKKRKKYQKQVVKNSEKNQKRKNKNSENLAKIKQKTKYKNNVQSKHLTQ